MTITPQSLLSDLQEDNKVLKEKLEACQNSNVDLRVELGTTKSDLERAKIELDTFDLALTREKTIERHA